MLREIKSHFIVNTFKREIFGILSFPLEAQFSLNIIQTTCYYIPYLATLGNLNLNKPAVAVRKTASVDLGNLYQDAKNIFLRIEPLIVGGMLTKIGQKLFTH